ncbi:diaminopimelate epimerase [Brevibacterium daeguense]|uniref:Diaminopimelate epimerase n=1 Tax=Brevibacterium daeguense TaxID=909936 RepID=A0ABP8EM19_9MICO|nr:diaminopimelate epimerase [Brevibacterium daeguense]
MGRELTKGHGTANDFVLLLDPNGDVEVSAAEVALLCDRRRGIGGDGFIRVVRTSHARIPEAPAAAEAGAEWFMDYRNGDGSIAEMCGNGVRVFVHFLAVRGLVDVDSEVSVGTRAGVKSVTRIADPLGGSAPWYRVDMGPWRFPAPIAGGADSLVTTAGIDVARPGLSVDLGNPHTVVALAGAADLAAADLTRRPQVEPVPGNGTNVEYIVIEPDHDGDPSTGRLSMRVHERGVGETQSCGTGACAAALAARYWAGDAGPSTWFVSLPGGIVRIEITDDDVALSGPAVLVADIALEQEFSRILA